MGTFRESIGEFLFSPKQFTLTHLVVIFFLILFIQSSVVGLHRVVSSSMEDTLLIGDVMLVVKTWYGFRAPFFKEPLATGCDLHRSDVLLFEYPIDPKQVFVKRCVAVGGDTVRISGKTLFVNGREISLPGNAKHADPSVIPKDQAKRDFLNPVVVPPRSLFVMGDNRDFSSDSRLWGCVSERSLIGKAVIILFSIDPNAPWTDLPRKLRTSRFFKDIR